MKPLTKAQLALLFRIADHKRSHYDRYEFWGSLEGTSDNRMAHVLAEHGLLEVSNDRPYNYAITKAGWDLIVAKGGTTPLEYRRSRRAENKERRAKQAEVDVAKKILNDQVAERKLSEIDDFLGNLNNG